MSQHYCFRFVNCIKWKIKDIFPAEGRVFFQTKLFLPVKCLCPSVREKWHTYIAVKKLEKVHFFVNMTLKISRPHWKNFGIMLKLLKYGAYQYSRNKLLLWCILWRSFQTQTKLLDVSKLNVHSVHFWIFGQFVKFENLENFHGKFSSFLRSLNFTQSTVNLKIFC